MSEDEEQGEGGLEGEEDPSADRRGDPRHLACFPAYVEADASSGSGLPKPQGVPRSALIRDLSVSGALLLTRARLAVGDTIKLSLHLGEGREPRVTLARVVREERRPNEMVHPWTKSVAVQFEEPIPELEAEARTLAERQAVLAGRRAPVEMDPQAAPDPARPRGQG
jgi:hypothetical protein